jgi:ribosome modulation factor
MTINAPPPVGPRGMAVRCAAQGGQDFAAGRPLNACPYGPSRPLSRRAWLVGYVNAARAAGAPLPEDAELEADVDGPWPGDS